MALVVKIPPSNAGDRDAASIPGSGRSPGVGNGNSLQYSGLENTMDREAWQATVHSVAQSRTRLKRLSMHARSLITWLLKSTDFSPTGSRKESQRNSKQAKDFSTTIMSLKMKEATYKDQSAPRGAERNPRRMAKKEMGTSVLNLHRTELCPHELRELKRGFLLNLWTNTQPDRSLNLSPVGSCRKSTVEPAQTSHLQVGAVLNH